jgi:hypothetical protein
MKFSTPDWALWKTVQLMKRTIPNTIIKNPRITINHPKNIHHALKPVHEYAY